MRIFFQTEHAENVIIFMHGFAIIASFLFVPPIAVGITKRPFLWRWIGVATGLICLKLAFNIPYEVHRDTDHAWIINVGLGKASYLGAGDGMARSSK